MAQEAACWQQKNDDGVDITALLLSCGASTKREKETTQRRIVALEEVLWRQQQKDEPQPQQQ